MHMRGVVSRHRSTAQRGADPDPLRDVQAYLAVKFRDKGLLDITAPGGIDTTWTQVGTYGMAGRWIPGTCSNRHSCCPACSIHGCSMFELLMTNVRHGHSSGLHAVQDGNCLGWSVFKTVLQTLQWNQML